MTMLHVKELIFQGRGPYSFDINGGQCCGLTGPSGSGKSLLLRALADLDPHTGKIMLDDIDNLGISAPLWRKRVGMLPAECLWWFDRVEDHFSREVEINYEWFGQLGFDHDVMNWQVHHLSTGEKQRLGILRLLHNRPAALLLDEPTASLDSANIGRAETLLVSYCKENVSPVLWVSHDKEQLSRVAGFLMIMAKDGQITVQEGE